MIRATNKHGISWGVSHMHMYNKEYVQICGSLYPIMDMTVDEENNIHLIVQSAHGDPIETVITPDEPMHKELLNGG